MEVAQLKCVHDANTNYHSLLNLRLTWVKQADQKPSERRMQFPAIKTLGRK